MCFFLVGTVGIEPMTSCMSSMRSNQLSYASATDGIIPYAEGFVKGFLKSFLGIFRRMHERILKNVREGQLKKCIFLIDDEYAKILSKIFEKIITGAEVTSDEAKSRLFSNYNYFKDRLNDLDENTIVDFYNALANLDIVDLNLKIEDDLEAVQKIFEKINSTGKKLSIADLVRNYLLVSRSVDTQKRLYDNYWVKIEELYKDKEKISDFTKHYLI